MRNLYIYPHKIRHERDERELLKLMKSGNDVKYIVDSYKIDVSSSWEAIIVDFMNKIIKERDETQYEDIYFVAMGYSPFVYAISAVISSNFNYEDEITPVYFIRENGQLIMKKIWSE